VTGSIVDWTAWACGGCANTVGVTTVAAPDSDGSRMRTFRGLDFGARQKARLLKR
jgi:hypothetical protein